MTTYDALFQRPGSRWDPGKPTRELMREDPWAVHGILVAADIKEWTIFLDARER